MILGIAELEVPISYGEPPKKSNEAKMLQKKLKIESFRKEILQKRNFYCAKYKYNYLKRT